MLDDDDGPLLADRGEGLGQRGGVGELQFGAGKANELRELVDEIRERGDFTFDQARAFLNQAGEFRIGHDRGANGGGAFRTTREEAREAL